MATKKVFTDASLQTLVEEIKSYVDSKTAMVKLWENNEPDEALAAGTLYPIGASFGNYKAFAVYHKYSTSAEGTRVQLAMFNKTTILDADRGNSAKVASRAIRIKSGSITFEDAYYDGAVNNDYIIPVAIYGLPW